MEDMLDAPLLFAPMPLGDVHGGRANYAQYTGYDVLQEGLAREMKRHDELNATLDLVSALVMPLKAHLESRPALVPSGGERDRSVTVGSF
eukprot:8604674-Pyramimonas_sp.AAC.2